MQIRLHKKLTNVKKKHVKFTFMPPKSQLKYPDISLTIRVNSSQIITSLSGCPSPLLGRAIRKLEVNKCEKAFLTEWNSILIGFFRTISS